MTTAVQRFYRFHARVYDQTRWLLLPGRREIVERLALQPDSRVLEVGCGTGLSFEHIVARLDPVRGRLVGVDFSAPMLARARRRVAARGWSNVSIVLGDAIALPFGGQPFDAVLFAYSLSMVPDWSAALERAREHLRPGGRLGVLDFATFAGWGPLAPLLRGWLRLNHVETCRPYVARMSELFSQMSVEYRLGGYCFAAVCIR